MSFVITQDDLCQIVKFKVYGNWRGSSPEGKIASLLYDTPIPSPPLFLTIPHYPYVIMRDRFLKKIKV